MSDFTLKAISPLDGFAREFDGISLTEVEMNRAIVSMATPLGEEQALSDSVDKAFGTVLPSAGQSVQSEWHNLTILGLTGDQTFLLFDQSPGLTPLQMLSPLELPAYLTDQSDSWAMLQISGANCRDALERICPIDLAPDVFASGAVARTAMEHLGVIITRNDQDSFLLMSATSSARSFLHAVQTSISNILA